jgi:hypothetical protein
MEKSIHTKPMIHFGGYPSISWKKASQISKHNRLPINLMLLFRSSQEEPLIKEEDGVTSSKSTNLVSLAFLVFPIYLIAFLRAFRSSEPFLTQFLAQDKNLQLVQVRTDSIGDFVGEGERVCNFIL